MTLYNHTIEQITVGFTVFNDVDLQSYSVDKLKSCEVFLTEQMAPNSRFDPDKIKNQFPSSPSTYPNYCISLTDVLACLVSPKMCAYYGYIFVMNGGKIDAFQQYKLVDEGTDLAFGVGSVLPTYKLQLTKQVGGKYNLSVDNGGNVFVCKGTEVVPGVQNKTLAIVGGIAGLIVLVLIIMFIVFMLSHKKKSEE